MLGCREERAMPVKAAADCHRHKQSCGDRNLVAYARTSALDFDQCAVNVPQGLQSREFFEAFEGTSEPSVRAFVVGKRLIRLGGQYFH